MSSLSLHNELGKMFLVAFCMTFDPVMILLSNLAEKCILLHDFESILFCFLGMTGRGHNFSEMTLDFFPTLIFSD